MRADEEIRQGPRPSSAGAPVFFKRLAGLKRGGERQGQMCECGEAVLQFLLGVELYGEFGEDHGVVSDRPLIRPLFELGT